MGRLKNLKTLKFFSNAVNSFPREFGNLVELECLQVKVGEPGINGLELSKLTKLIELELSRVPPRLSAFPFLSAIVGLKCLIRLSVCHFSIRYLPPEIGCLNNLEYLDLSFNKMRNLPDEITSLNLLIQLKVTNNKLIDLPLRLSCPQRLEILDLSNNRLTSLKYSELESMHNFRILNLQHNQLRGYQIPSWICCNLGGNISNLSNDESADMDVYDGVIQDIHGNKRRPSPPGPRMLSANTSEIRVGSCVAPLSSLSGLSPNNRSLAARRGDRWKRRYNLQTKAQQERLSYCRKLKVDAASQSTSGKCTTCRVSGHSDNASSKDLSVVPEEKLINEYLSPECEVQGNSVTCPGSLSDAVEVLDGGSYSQYSHCVEKPKSHSEKDLDNPKPSKSRRPTNDPSYLSCQYSERSFCGVANHLPDGFYDAGRDCPFMPLGSYEKKLLAQLGSASS